MGYSEFLHGDRYKGSAAPSLLAELLLEDGFTLLLESGDKILVESGPARKISALPVAGALTGGDLVPIVQGGVTVKVALAPIVAWIVGEL